VTSARPSARVPNYEAWLAKGYHGELKYMARADRVARRRDPRLVLPGARAVVMSSLFYWPGRAGFPAAHDVGSERDAGGRGVVSCYAWGADYHEELETRLRALGEWLRERAGGVARYYVDTGAVLERDFAERAGLGFVGKNSLLIHPRAGSGFFIGGLFTTVPLPLDGDLDLPAPVASGDAVTSLATARGKPGCGKCRKCIVACPTGAIVQDRVIDARRCISYLTIELKSAIPEALRPQMGARVYGCDICQQVCPWNAFDWGSSVTPGTPRTESGTSPLFGQPAREVTTPGLVALLWATRAAFRDRFRGTAIERIGPERMARNAAVALGNVGGAYELSAVGAAAVAHPSALVREHADWARSRIVRRVHADKERADDSSLTIHGR
jgi:epoxyqueuosine reductase